MSFYIRSIDGATFYVDTLKEGLTHLVGPQGYRLTIADGQGSEVVIRAGDWGKEMLGFEAKADLVVRLV